MKSFEYLKENQLISGGYINIPIKLYSSSIYEGLSNDAILLYGILRNNLKFSESSGLRDEKGRLFVIASLNEIIKLIRCSRNTARKILEELKKYYLIEVNDDDDKNRFRNIYLGDIKIDTCEVKKSTDTGLERESDGIKKSTSTGSKKVPNGIKKSTSRGSNYEHQRGQNLNPNKNIYKNTYKNGMYQNVSGESYPYYQEFDFED